MPPPGERRHIRLKEFGRKISRAMEPPDPYLAVTNGTIAKDEYLLNTDDDGFICNPATSGEARNSVYVLGDSFVESVYVQEGKRFCDVLTNLDKENENRVFRNAGYSGSTSLNLFNVLTNKILGEADFSVVHILPSNDILSLQNDHGFWNFDDKRYAPIVPARTGEIEKSDIERNYHQLSKVLRMMVAARDVFSFKLYFATCPYIRKDYAGLPWFRRRHRRGNNYQELMEKRAQANDVMRKVAADSATVLIDLENLLSNNSHFYDDVHLNELGSQFAAEQIYCSM